MLRIKLNHGMPLQEDIPKYFFKPSNLQSVICAMICFLGLVTPGTLAYSIGTIEAYVFAFFLVGIFGEAFFILQHEAMHANFSTSRRFNEAAGIIMSGILGTRLHDGRSIHIRHHIHLGDAKGDPNLYWYDETKIHNRSEVFSFILKILFGGKLWQAAKRVILILQSISEKHQSASSENIAEKTTLNENSNRLVIDLSALLLIQLSVFIVISLLSSPWVYFVFFLVPIVTVTPFLEAVRAISEHIRLPNEVVKLPAIQRLYFVDANFFETLLLAPFGFHYHHLHHIYPKVPVFKLKGLHLWMADNFHGYENSYLKRRGYCAILFDYDKQLKKR